MDTNSLTVMPMSQEISLTPGETYTGSITVANPSSSAGNLPYKASISPYGVTGTKYNVDMLSENSHTEMVNWLTVHSASGTLAPNDKVDISFTIKVPSDAAPGGQYAAIKIRKEDPTTTDNGVNIGNIYEVASIIYANVIGEVVRDGKVTNQTIPSFITTPEFTSTATIENHGTTHEDAMVSFIITNAFNGGTIYPYDKSDTGINEVIMPDTTRELSYTFKDMPAVGPINVTQTIEYNDQTYTHTQTIFICPIWFMIVVAVLIASLLSLIIFHIKKSRRRKNKSSL
ncbi:MAG: hypothetical protein U0L97_04580 [Candidatus Saccharimonadaceae bacterium]|nr:hypothetical protein [Candidatus Saccharimonadaceae bacterium]